MEEMEILMKQFFQKEQNQVDDSEAEPEYEPEPEGEAEPDYSGDSVELALECMRGIINATNPYCDLDGERYGTGSKLFSKCEPSSDSIYDEDYEFTQLKDGKKVKLSSFRGEILMIVNTASF
jgi:hypothetical protein